MDMRRVESILSEQAVRIYFLYIILQTRHHFDMCAAAALSSQQNDIIMIYELRLEKHSALC